jgi:LysR family transcriptional regulator, transcriptional activator of nhaA
LPGSGSPVRRALDQWFDSLGISPPSAGEFDDDALLESFGAAGLGLFCAPYAVAADVRRRHRVQIAGRTSEVRVRFYALSGERRPRHPAVIEIIARARRDLLAAH